MSTKPKEVGQHMVYDIVKVFHQDAAQNLRDWAKSAGNRGHRTVIRELTSDVEGPAEFDYLRGWTFEINWLPKPNQNKGDTRHEYGQALLRNLETGVVDDSGAKKYHSFSSGFTNFNWEKVE